MLSIVVADDHAIFRRGVCAILEADPSIKILGEAANGWRRSSWRNACSQMELCWTS
jgi:DNA-binding NarL/FixJ family response regulator